MFLLDFSGFPIRVSVPKDSILLGAKGTSDPKTIAELSEAVVRENFQGIMVWYASVKNGLTYAESWDASENEAAQEAFVKTMNKFNTINIYG